MVRKAQDRENDLMAFTDIAERRQLRRKLTFWRVAAFLLVAGAIVEQRRRGVGVDAVKSLDASPRDVVIHEHPRPAVDR